MLYKYNLSNMNIRREPYEQLGSSFTLSKEIKLPSSPSKMVSLLSKMFNFDDDDNGNISVSMRADNHIIIKMDDMRYKIVLSERIKDILGLSEKVLTAPNTYISKRPFSCGFSHLYVYCNITDYTMVHDKEEQLLLVIPLNDKTISHPTYFPLKTTRTKQIDISIRNANM